MFNPEAELAALLQTEMAENYFTAFYAECGFLDRSEATLRLLQSKEGGGIFDLASLTKALVTGPLVHQLLRSEGFQNSVPIGNWARLPEHLTLPERLSKLETAKVLAHTSGLPAWWNFWIGILNADSMADRNQIMDRIREVLQRIPLRTEGSDLYSDVGYILLGYALEGRASISLAEQFEEFKRALRFPHNMPLGFRPSLANAGSDFVPSSYCSLRGRILRGEVHDENCAALGGVAGHAGLFASGEALSTYLRYLYKTEVGQSYLRANEEARIKTKADGLLGLRRGNGPSVGGFGGGQAMGHLGFTGTAFWLDMASRKYSIFLTNRVISGRLSPRMTELRSKVFQLMDAQLAR